MADRTWGCEYAGAISFMRAIPTISFAAALFVSAACNFTSPTADGTSLLKATFAAGEGGPPATLHVTPTNHTRVIAVNPDKAAEVEVTLAVVKDPASGAQYLTSVQVAVARNGEGEMTAGLIGTHMNLGTTTTPLESRSLSVTWVRDTGYKTYSGTTMITLKADGTVTVQ